MSTETIALNGTVTATPGGATVSTGTLTIPLGLIQYWTGAGYTLSNVVSSNSTCGSAITLAESDPSTLVATLNHCACSDGSPQDDCSATQTYKYDVTRTQTSGGSAVYFYPNQSFTATGTGFSMSAGAGSANDLTVTYSNCAGESTSTVVGTAPAGFRDTFSNFRKTSGATITPPPSPTTCPTVTYTVTWTGEANYPPGGAPSSPPTPTSGTANGEASNPPSSSAGGSSPPSTADSPGGGGQPSSAGGTGGGSGGGGGGNLVAIGQAGNYSFNPSNSEVPALPTGGTFGTLSGTFYTPAPSPSNAPSWDNFYPQWITSPNGEQEQVPWNGLSTLTGACPGSGQITTGSSYPVVYASPMLLRQSFAQWKRLAHAYLQFDNEMGMQVHTAQTTGESTRYGRVIFELGASLGFVYHDRDSDEYVTDLYRYDPAIFNSSLQTAHAPKTLERHTMFKEPLVGVSYGAQLYVYSNDNKTWKLVGWQVDVNAKGKKTRNTFD